MSRTRPYPTRPSSQFAAPAFYWRGGDTLHETETLSDNYKKALSDYRKAELEVKEIERRINDAKQTLHERETMSNTLVNYLDQDADGNNAEIGYKKQLIEVQQAIKDAESELQWLKRLQHPGVASSLQKEKACLMIDMQRQVKEIEMARAQHENDLRKVAEIEISPKYQSALELEGKFSELQKKKNFLRQLVNKNKKDFEMTKPVRKTHIDEQNLRSRDSRSERATLLSNIDVEQSLDRANEKKKRREAKWNNQIERLINQLEDLNTRMEELGIEDETVDIDEIRRRYQEEETNHDDSDAQY